MPAPSVRKQKEIFLREDYRRRTRRKFNWHGAAGLLAMIISGAISLKLGWEIGKYLAGN